MPEPTAFERLPPGHRVELPDVRRAPTARLEREIGSVTRSPVVTAVLEVSDALLVVLNRERQIVAFNSRVASVRSVGDVLGRRPGEALLCLNAAGPGGCGTAPACTTCGALGAILGCQQRLRSVESACVIPARAAGTPALEFAVRATPVTVEGERFTVVSLRDISSEKRREVLEQVFFHDVMNTVAGLRGWALRLRRPGADVPHATERMDFLSGQLEREIRDHRALLLAESGQLVPEVAAFPIGEVVADVSAVFAGHPVARDRHLAVAPPPAVALTTDRALLQRVLVNMVRNALEATEPDGLVRLACEADDRSVTVRVHNAAVMPPEVQARVFQRSFSTKAQHGRGLGTYAMKLFGEGYLGGTVTFVSRPGVGTEFAIRLPRPASAATTARA